MIRRRLYLAAPGDVPALELEAERLLDTTDASGLAALVTSVGAGDPDLALMLLYRACFRGANGEFLRQLTDVADDLSPLAAPLRVLVIPGLNFARHPETGADGRLIETIGARLGADVKILAVDPRDAASGNGARLAEQLARVESVRTWLVSISKGTADFRAALGLIGSWPEWLAGWINLSGVFQGTPVADRLTGLSPAALLIRSVIALGGMGFPGISEMRTDSPLWLQRVQPPSPRRLIHVLGFPPSWSIEMRIAHHYRWLRDNFGPNDGVIPLIDSLTYPGRILPVWGADHFMRIPDFSRLVYRLFQFVSALQREDAC